MAQHPRADHVGDAWLQVIGDHQIGALLDSVIGVAHGYAQTGRFQHAEIVVVIPEGHHLIHVQSLRLDPLLQAFALAVAAFGDIYLIVP